MHSALRFFHDAPLPRQVRPWFNPWMPRRPRKIGRPRSPGRRISLIALVAAVAALAVADRLGLFGSSGDDVERYHNRIFTVTRVIDGDTLDLEISDGKHATTRVRLWGVDTPEVNDPRRPGEVDHFGPEASDRTRELAEGKPVRVELVVDRKTRGTRGRLLAYIYLPDDSMLNERLLAEGFAYADWRFSHPRMQRFKDVEERAHKAGVGLWRDVTPGQMPDWRRRMMAGGEQPAETD